MPKLIFSQDEINAYLNEDKESFHPYREENIKAADRILVHAEGKFPENLISERRPNEPKEVLDYRKIIFVAKTKPTFSKVFSSLQKIRRSQEWAIRYPKDVFSRIREEETLDMYCERKYPFFTSVTNWVFDVVLRKYLIDPNAVGFVYPQNFGEGVEENDVVKPICEIFTSEYILDFVPENYAVLKTMAGVSYYHENVLMHGNSFYVITTERVMRYDQISSTDYAKNMDWLHGLGELPVFQLKGIVIDHCAKGFQYESRIAAMLPELDEAIREYSDLQAAKVLHIYPERWEYTQNECPGCKGLGKRQNPQWTADCGCETHLTCESCKGSGYIAAGPYSKIMVRPVSALEGGNQIPTPPAGYIDKDTKIVELQEEGVKQHLYYALAAINYEHLAETPLATSGVSKDFDRDEANNWTHSVGEDIVAFTDNVYYFTAKYRYKELYPNEEDILKMLPAINVPERFDLVSSTQMQKELIDAKNGKFNALIQSALEDSYTGARFATEPEVRKRLQLTFRLDPLPNVSQEDKFTMLSNNGITKTVYIISSNINEFVQRAVHENPEFANEDLTVQKAKMDEYAKAQIAANDIATGIINDVNNQPEPVVDAEVDILGKVPLAIQQLSLAATRAEEAGNIPLKNQILKKVDTLLATI